MTCSVLDVRINVNVLYTIVDKQHVLMAAAVQCPIMLHHLRISSLVRLLNLHTFLYFLQAFMTTEGTVVFSGRATCRHMKAYTFLSQWLNNSHSRWFFIDAQRYLRLSWLSFLFLITSVSVIKWEQRLHVATIRSHVVISIDYGIKRKCHSI